MSKDKTEYYKIKGAKFKGARKTSDIILKHIKGHEDNIRNCLRTHGKIVTTELENVIKTSIGNGRHYAHLPNRSSSSGNPPVSQSHELEQSFKYRSRPMELVIGNTAKSDKGEAYPTFLEKGTKKMAKRPYFVSTIERLHADLEKDLQRFDS